MPGDTWVKVHTDIITNAAFVGLPTNEHRYALFVLNILNKRGIHMAPDAYIAGVMQLSQERWVEIKRDLVANKLIDESNAIIGFDDSQLTPDAWRKRRQRERDASQDNSVTSHGTFFGNAECRMQSAESRLQKQKKDTSGATSGDAASPVFVLMPVNDGDEAITQDEVDRWSGLYGRIDVAQSLRNMVGYWSSVDRSRRKTRRGIRKSITGWLARENDRAPVGQSPSWADRMQKELDGRSES